MMSLMYSLYTRAMNGSTTTMVSVTLNMNQDMAFMPAPLLEVRVDLSITEQTCVFGV